MIAAATDVARSTERLATPAIGREAISGADRMTSAERDAYRHRMASAPEEKAKIRADKFAPRLP